MPSIKHTKKSGVKLSNKQSVHIKIDNRRISRRKSANSRSQPRQQQPVIVSITQSPPYPIYNPPIYNNPIHEVIKEHYPVKTKTSVGETIGTKIEEKIPLKTAEKIPLPSIAEETPSLKMPSISPTSANRFFSTPVGVSSKLIPTPASGSTSDGRVETTKIIEKDGKILYPRTGNYIIDNKRNREMIYSYINNN